MEIKVPSVIINHPNVNDRLTNYGFRNWLTNGSCFFPDTEYQVSGDGGYLIDGWRWSGTSQISKIKASVSESQSIGGMSYYLKAIQGTSVILYQKILNARSFINNTVSLSFWYKNLLMNADSIMAFLTFKIGDIELQNVTLGSTVINNFGIWNRIGFTKEIGTILSNETGRVDAVLGISIPAGTCFITGMQLEIGDNYTDFEHIGLAEEQERCMRKIITQDVYLHSPVLAKEWVFSYTFPAIMEEVPTVSLKESTFNSDYQVSFENITQFGFYIRVKYIGEEVQGEVKDKRIKFFARTY